jgi:hypothetical protein
MNDHLTIVTGHYGSGKTEFAVNLAFRLTREGNAVTLADLDIVNPYFCSRERKAELTEKGIRVIVSKGADSDLPAINPEVYALFEPGMCGIIDAGGDAPGAQALGRFSQKIKCIPYELLCVVNFNRPETNTPQKAAAYLREIEYSARISATGLVNNTHLDHETTTHDILRGAELLEELSAISGIPVKYHAFEERFSGRLALKQEQQFPMQLYMKKPWEF